ncbi:DNA-3-methyladenine glycosylase [Candidatus Nitrososphaera evergladensis SR1]|jgi:DNA-3-methyladenine glycosylase|uniref:Putative 3-methyladenine DNA glycosylase n=1 Tax=Candidatus Nitrososphaera evergladensis SR1 TaxID=1459636 RepID=A0A075MS35_9ARCH|nr:DNA-3-methyladenine glycosylase [Candidatus Nitrososphaera evergladensis]AIF83622.1 DNA-3-methyladenine glycosylase [Candidatus Nitrososphaera evergladensis SR1]
MLTLARSFYQRPTTEVARDLIGKVLVRRLDDDGGRSNRLSGIIVETEAYGHAEDPASHACRGMTERNRVMFGEAGMAYVYFTYGNHHCINVSARNGAPAGAVLIRSIEPVDGIKEMRRRRGLDDPYLLTTGPGRLAQAMNITRRQNGVDMTDPESEITIEDGPARETVMATARIGISKATDVQWRFVDPASAFLSRKRARPASLQVK